VVYCRPSSVQTFITRSDISTSTGYPLQITGGTRIRLQTLVIFRYRTDCQLCNAARATNDRRRRQVPDVGGPSRRRRRRRQVTVNTNEMSQELINTILADEDKLVRRNFMKLLYHSRRRWEAGAYMPQNCGKNYFRAKISCKM